MIDILPMLRLDLARQTAPVVLCQDASVLAPGCPTGAYCVGVGDPSFSSICAVARRCEANGPAYVLDVAQRAPLHIVASAALVPTLERTILPRAWFEEPNPWQLLLARRWRFPEHMNVGETRAAVLLQSAISKVRALQHHVVLDASDNLVTVGVLSRGRSAPHNLNLLCRRRAALEGATADILVSHTCVSTDYQLVDSGTHPGADGLLHRVKQSWQRPHIFLEVFAGSASLTQSARTCRVVRSGPWDLQYGDQFQPPHQQGCQEAYIPSFLPFGLIGCVWFAPPCYTFSRARQFDRLGPPPLKDRTSVTACATRMTRSVDIEKVESQLAR